MKRLLHYQSVGHSSATAKGRVSPLVCTEGGGWEIHLSHTLRPLIRRLGPGAFDWWGHNTAGIWLDRAMSGNAAAMLFNQVDIARDRFPALIDYAPLAAVARKSRMNLFGYVGYPHCDGQSPRDQFNNIIPEQCERGSMKRWYGPFVEHGFSGIGHDWTAHLPNPKSGRAEDKAWTVNLRFLKAHGMRFFLEAMPLRDSPWLLGMDVVATERMWQISEQRPDRYFTEREIVAAGGRCVHLVLRSPADLNLDAAGDLAWRYKRAYDLLGEGKTVACNLAAMQRFNVEALVLRSMNGIDKLVKYLNYLFRRRNKTRLNHARV